MKPQQALDMFNQLSGKLSEIEDGSGRLLFRVTMNGGSGSNDASIWIHQVVRDSAGRAIEDKLIHKIKKNGPAQISQSMEIALKVADEINAKEVQSELIQDLRNAINETELEYTGYSTSNNFVWVETGGEQFIVKILKDTIEFGIFDDTYVTEMPKKITKEWFAEIIKELYSEECDRHLKTFKSFRSKIEKTGSNLAFVNKFPYVDEWP